MTGWVNFISGVVVVRCGVVWHGVCVVLDA